MGSQPFNYPPIIALASGDDRAISIAHVLATGRIELSANPGNHVTLDLTQHHSSTNRALEQVRVRVLADMQHNSQLQDLLAKPHWGREEREQYERVLTDTVARSYNEHPLFRDYRANQQRSGARDITHLHEGEGQDCMPMAVTKGIIMSRVEGQLLREQPGNNALRQPQEYYVVGGIAQSGDRPFSAHAALMSSATGNMIEASGDRGTYFRSRYQTSFADFVSGMPFLSSYDLPDGTRRNLPYQFSGGTAPSGLVAQRQAALQAGDGHALVALTHPPRSLDEQMSGIRQGEQLLAARSQLAGLDQELGQLLARLGAAMVHVLNGDTARPRGIGALPVDRSGPAR